MYQSKMEGHPLMQPFLKYLGIISAIGFGKAYLSNDVEEESACMFTFLSG